MVLESLRVFVFLILEDSKLMLTSCWFQMLRILILYLYTFIIIWKLRKASHVNSFRKSKLGNKFSKSHEKFIFWKLWIIVKENVNKWTETSHCVRGFPLIKLSILSKLIYGPGLIPSTNIYLIPLTNIYPMIGWLLCRLKLSFYIGQVL